MEELNNLFHKKDEELIAAKKKLKKQEEDLTAAKEKIKVLDT